MKLIGTGARGDIDDRTGIAAVFGAISRVINLKFGNGVDGWLECDLILHHVVQVDAVDHKVDGIFAATCGIECKRTLSAERRGKESVLRWSDRAGNEKGEVHKMAAV